ncbi:MAG TPA: hypothetical protein VIQ51_08410, partial [Chryseosolibacter sp.]
MFLIVHFFELFAFLLRLIFGGENCVVQFRTRTAQKRTNPLNPIEDRGVSDWVARARFSLFDKTFFVAMRTRQEYSTLRINIFSFLLTL